MKRCLLVLGGFFLLSGFVFPQVLDRNVDAGFVAQVRIKDIGKIIESRDNQLIGFGLVVGLRGTGDSGHATFTNKALSNLLKKVGVSPSSGKSKVRNVAGVIVTANFPPYIKQGQRISVLVSSLGDASSLSGGTLLMTQLQGADGKTYAVAQGQVIVGGVQGKTKVSSYIKNQTTVGRVPGGAIVELEVPVTHGDQNNITIVLNQPDFMTSSRVSRELEKNGFKGVRSVDASTVKIPLASVQGLSYVDAIAKIENTKVQPDTVSKVVINAKTGTVVIGHMVRLFPVAITYGGISVNIKDSRVVDPYSESTFNRPGESDQNAIQIEEDSGKLVQLQPEATLASLVEALNDIGASPRDMISILQALKEAGALIANIEVI